MFLKIKMTGSTETLVTTYKTIRCHKSDDRSLTRRGADKSLAFPILAQLKEFFLDGLKIGRRSDKHLWSSGGICRVNTFLQSRNLLFSL
jgi:hypothetical protein